MTANHVWPLSRGIHAENAKRLPSSIPVGSRCIIQWLVNVFRFDQWRRRPHNPLGAPVNRLTDKSREVIELASWAAHNANLDVFGADHVLLGIAQCRMTNVAGVILQRLDVSLQPYVDGFNAVPGGDPTPKSQLSPEFLSAAYDEARSLDHRHVGTEHLLLAIAASGASASRFLRAAGVDYAVARKMLVEVMGTPPAR